MSGEIVAGLGLCTPIGTSAEMTAASMRAGVARFMETEVEDDYGEPVRASRLTTLDISLSRTERMIALGRGALAGVRDQLAVARTGRVALYLGLPEPGVGAPAEAQALVGALQEEAGVRLDLAGTWEAGRAGFFEALAAARADLRSGRGGAMALIGAVDSLCDGASLSAIAAARLHLGTQNPDGRIPGEAAGFVVLTRAGAAEAKALRALCVVLGAALGVERAPFASRTPSFSEGLTEVFQALRGDPALGGRRVDRVLACQPGESFWGTEFSRAYLRNAALMPEPLTVALAGETLGDAGAGAAPVMLAAALAQMRRRARAARRAQRALLYGSADGGRIGGCVVESSAEG